jgi:hypothetical protein
MIVQMACNSELVLAYISVSSNVPQPETAVSLEPIFCEIKVAAD